MENNLNEQSEEIEKLQLENKKLQNFLNQDINGIPSKEKDLKNQLEIKHQEFQALVKEKDRSLIKLKRELDQSDTKMQFYIQNQKKLEKEQTQKNNQIDQVIENLEKCIKLLKNKKNIKKSDIFTMDHKIVNRKKIQKKKKVSYPLLILKKILRRKNSFQIRPLQIKK